jgi:hypothetical protein
MRKLDFDQELIQLMRKLYGQDLSGSKCFQPMAISRQWGYGSSELVAALESLELKGLLTGRTQRDGGYCLTDLGVQELNSSN